MFRSPGTSVSPILGPGPAPYHAGYWGATLLRLYVSTISQPHLKFDCLPIPARAKLVRPFLLSWFDSMAQVRPRIPSRECLWQKRKIEKKVSVDHGNAYRTYPSWLFPTNPGASPLVHICRNQCQYCQVWRQWCIQPVDTINIRSGRHPASTCLGHPPDGYSYLIWYGSNGLGVWHVLTLKIPSGKVKEFDTHLVVMCDYQVTLAAAKCVMDLKGGATYATVALEVEGGNIVTCT